ncbi:hypothetical protein Mapa_011564 [Marchantia paleacea]|nr:hypothetical protein Mapa_011564 [Marchantia paleacea]
MESMFGFKYTMFTPSRAKRLPRAGSGPFREQHRNLLKAWSTARQRRREPEGGSATWERRIKKMNFTKWRARARCDGSLRSIFFQFGLLGFCYGTSKKRGLSLDEKREQMLQIFYESQGFYQLKDLEKLGPKKGVISQSVKDVVQSLVDDDLVFKDKIGTSVYFWSLSSRAGNQLRQVRMKLETELEAAKKRQADLQTQRELAKKGREDSSERELALNALNELQKKHKAIKEELDLYAQNDPAVYEAMNSVTDVAHKAVNRWTENIFALQQWCANTFPEAKERLEHAYAEVGIKEDLDYLD